MQIQQRQHLGHLRRLARPRRQDRRGKPLPFTGIGIDTRSLTRGAVTLTAPAAVSTSRCVVIAVADHQTPAVLVDLIG